VVEDTPAGAITFSNLIFTSKVRKSKSILVAAHYDSKILEADGRSDLSKEQMRALIEESKFIGATDSGFACALMVSLAQELESSLQAADFTLQFVFFDGEEAMLSWSQTDSLYGSQRLAAKWSASGHLKQIELLILMDLIGAADAKEVHSFHPAGSQVDTEFQHLKRVERALFSNTEIFSDSQKYVHLQGFGIEDDHIPFQRRGVSVLHLIPIPFPGVWHTERDTIGALDSESCLRFSQVILEYLKQKLKLKENKVGG
jgi:glutaminyl-peptide cyclotransferase